MNQAKPLLFINLEQGGHHHLHVCHLVRFGLADGESRFLLPRRLLEDAAASLAPGDAAALHARTTVLEEEPLWQKASGRTKRPALRNWLFLEALNRHERKRRLFLLYVESLFYPLALSPLPRHDVAGILFRPTFHYWRERMLGAARKEYAVFALKYLCARLLALRPGVRQLFVFDPIAQQYAATRWATEKFSLLPDPLGPEPGMARPLGGSAPVMGRPLTVLIAGALSPRKGLRELADALAQTSEAMRAGVRLRVVGRPDRGAEDYVKAQLARIEALGVAVDATLAFVTDAEMDDAIAASDVVLTAYVGFKGSSGILIRAAHFGKPVVSTSSGLLGRLVNTRELGTTVDVGDAQSFAATLEQVIVSGRVHSFNPAAARAFADEADPFVFAGLLTGRQSSTGEQSVDAAQPGEMAVSRPGGA